MKNKYVIVISFDAVSEEDLEFLSKQPNFSKLIKNGALIKNVESVYPSLTYPAHATIVTGKYPKNHGVINNTVLDFKNDISSSFSLIVLFKVLTLKLSALLFSVRVLILLFKFSINISLE